MMQQFIDCTENAFLFGEPDKIVLRHYDYLVPRNCLRLSRVHRGLADPKYGYRYKLLWDAATNFIEVPNSWVDGYDSWVDHSKSLVRDCAGPTRIAQDGYHQHPMDDYVLALVVISSGPLFVDIRKQRRSPSTGVWELDEGIHCQLYLAASSIDEHLRSWPAIGKAYGIPLSIEPTESGLRLAASWLEECLAGNGKHQQCASAQEPPALPARVIDVGSSPGAAPRLHISEDGETGHYVALSHCWGGSAAVMCTTSSLRQLVKMLPVDLPKTFADAIAVTRALGQKYLWIDSFCIVQDSMADWARESQRMDQVYSHALFTVMADAAEDSLSGFLEPPARSIRKHNTLICEVPSINDAEASRVEIHLRQRGDLAYQLPYHDFSPTRPPTLFDDKDLRSKLSTRAWAFQERLLSPRTLHFAPSEMAWECRGVCNCECSATNERTIRTTSLLKGSIALMPTDTLNNSDQSPYGILRTLDHAWQRDIVEEYTKLSITKDTDRPFGIAGLATKAMALRSGDQYLAGLWRKTLKTGLAWYVTHNAPSRRLPFEPTWSWVSVSGPIQHAPVAEAPFIDILDVDCIADAKSPLVLGPQNPAALTCSGYLVPIDSVWYQPCKPPSAGPGIYKSWYRSCYRVKWPANVALPENCLVMMDTHQVEKIDGEEVIFAPTDKGRKNRHTLRHLTSSWCARFFFPRLNRLDDLEVERREMTMLVMALSKDTIFGLLLSPQQRGGASEHGLIPEYERVGFVNNLNSTGTFVRQSSGCYEYVYEEGWDPKDEGGWIEILQKAGIRKTYLRIR